MIQSLSPEEAQALLASGGVDVVDVREPNEYASGHVPGARNVPLADVQRNPETHLPNDRVLLVCARGIRSQTAAQLAEQIGRREVYQLDGGTHAWLGAGLAVERVGPTVRAATVPAPAPPEIETIQPELDAVVGANVRALRAQRNLTLDQLARMTGLSRTVLGQIEIGQSAPSVGVVWKIAQAFDVPFSALLASQQTSETTVLRASSAKRLVSPDGRFSSRALFPFAEKQEVEFYELRLAGHSREDAMAHAPGTREYLVVNAGKLELHLGGRVHELEKGDAIVFVADVAHSYVNPGREECWMNLVMTYRKGAG